MRITKFLIILVFTIFMFCNRSYAREKESHRVKIKINKIDEKNRSLDDMPWLKSEKKIVKKDAVKKAVGNGKNKSVKKAVDNGENKAVKKAVSNGENKAVKKAVKVMKQSNVLLQVIFEINNTENISSFKKNLDELINKMLNDKTIRITMNSFASVRENGRSESRRISLKRALAVRKYFISKGVDKNHINIRALGDTVKDKPWDRIDIVVD